MKKTKTDALVIGSGVGGLTVAARLVKKGMNVVVIEMLPFVGGRFSSREYKGFTVTTGAIMIPFGGKGAFQEAFDLLNTPLNIRETKGATRYRLKHGEFEIPEKGGGLRPLLEFAMSDEVQANELVRQIQLAMSWKEPNDQISFRDWLSQYSDNTELHNLYQGFCGAFIGTSSNEVPAGEFFRFLRGMDRSNRYGICVNGNLEVMQSLAGAIEQRGSSVRLKTACRGIIVEKGRAKGVHIECDGVEEIIEADYVISNAGPSMTVKMAGRSNFERSYLALLDEHAYPTPVIHLCYTSPEPIHGDFSGIMNFGNTKSLVFLEIPTMTCPELAPEGQHLITTFNIPESSSEPLKLKEAVENAKRDLEDNFPLVKKTAKPLFIATHHGEWPSMRRWPGYPTPVRTPIVNLYNVGDGCMPPGTVGIEASALSARQVAEMIK